MSDYPNSGILSRNEKKDAANQPDHKGAADIDCQHCGAKNSFWLSAWIKNGSKGKFFSLAFTAKEEQRESEPKPDPEPEPDFDDDIPF